MNNSKNNRNFYLTTPIYYVNDVPHIGHAYTSIACDCLARFKRLDGYNVRFLTGTDEHGQKVEKSALSRNKTPQEFCDEISAKFREMADFLGISYNDFIRTTEDRHKESVQIFWEKLHKNGWIYKNVYEGWYAVRDEAFYSEDELVDGRAPTGADVEWHKEESYFFKLSDFEEILLKIYENFPDFIKPESRKNEVISFVKSGLNDLSISRISFKWGIPVPNDSKHVIYVWLDALVNYLSALDYPNGENFQNFWINAEYKMHIVGKDILRFHTVYWPAFLIASEFKKEWLSSPDLTHIQKTGILMNQVFAHGWWTNEGQKISKSLGNVIDPYKEIEWIKSFGVSQETAIDYFRYFLMREVPFGSDGDYSRERFLSRINSELVNNIGNLVQRSLTMIYKNCDGKIPAAKNSNSEEIKLWQEMIRNVKNLFEEKSFDSALANIMLIGSSANSELQNSAPWNLKKEGRIDEMNSALYFASEMIRIIAILLLPVIPNSAGKILDLLGISEQERNFDNLQTPIESGQSINEPKIIFPKLEAIK